MYDRKVASLATLALLAGTASMAGQVQPPTKSTAIEDRTVVVGAQRIHYLKAGSGETTIVLLHGWPQSSHEWNRVIPLLSEHFSVVAPDLPGIGGSSGPASDATLPVSALEKASLATSIHAFVATHIVLVGHDVGGMVAYAYARLYPKNPRALRSLMCPCLA